MSLSRRDFFKKLFCWEQTERPPGALSDDDAFKRLCTGCDLCMIACPVNVVMVEDTERRYPVIYPKKDPCIRCEDTPCITACPTGALQPLKIEV